MQATELLCFRSPRDWKPRLTDAVAYKVKVERRSRLNLYAAVGQATSTLGVVLAQYRALGSSDRGTFLHRESRGRSMEGNVGRNGSTQTLTGAVRSVERIRRMLAS